MTDVDRPRLGENRPNDFVESGGFFLSSCKGNNCPDFEGVENASEPAEYGEKLTETKAEHSATWTLQKKRSQELASVLRFMKSWRYGGEVDRCATRLALMFYKDTNSFKVRPFSTCKKRHCPLCAWVKTQKLWSYAAHNHPELVKDQGRLRYRLLTLTIENVPLVDLRSTVSAMIKAIRQLVKAKEWDAVGWVRSLEITYKEEANTYHPHIHILMASPWNSPMTTQRRWCAIWKRLMKLDYTPVCDIRAPVRRSGMSPAMSGMSETVKYLFKPSDLSKNPLDMVSAFEEVKGLRLLGSGGIFLSIFNRPEFEENETEKPMSVGVFGWRADECQYRKKIGGF
jgi:plasmid rolling circle replication initiator protein Rep